MNAELLSTQFANGITNPVIILDELVERLNKTKYIFISTCLDRAYREAEASKQRWKAKMPLSSFDGVPIAWKDLFDVAGTITTAGSATRKDNAPATQDANLVAKLTQLGMINIGKTNLSEFAYSGLGLNPAFGTPPNAVNELHAPGGSSSGAAVSVAKQIVPFSMGTDTAGSIRIPAAFNGLVGYRPSINRYSQQGVFPLASSLDTIGPLAHNVKDCFFLDQLILSQNYHIDFNNKNYADKGNFHLVVDFDILDHPDIQDDVTANFTQAVKAFQDAGVKVIFKKINAFHQALSYIDAGNWLGAAEAYTLHQKLLKSDKVKLMDQRVYQRLMKAKDILASTQIHLYEQARLLKQHIKNELGNGFLLTPTVAHTAPLLAPLEADSDLFVKTNSKTLRLTMPGSFLDMPAITLPNGQGKNGLPTGILISGVNGHDESLLHAAMQIEDILHS